MGKAQTFHHSIPFVAHKRLTVVTPPVHTVRVRPSVILAEIDRIHHKVRPSLAYQPAEDYLNSRSAVSFDDETRSIRAQTAALLKRIHEPLPRATKSFPISVTRYQETPIPERITSDAYIHRLLGPTRNVKQEILSISHYDEPAKRLMGKGHLACISFAGGRAFPKRRNLFVDDDRVKNDVKYLSLYKRNRDAAENPPKLEAAALSGDWFRSPAAYTSPPRSRPISRFYRPTFVADDNLPYQEPPVMPVKKTSSSRSQSQPTVETPASVPRAERQTSLKEDPLGEEFEDTAARMNRRKKKKQEEARLAEEEKQETLRQAELARQEKLALEAAAERQKELDKKAELARQAEEEAALKAEAERKAELERQEAERQAELERQEAERKAEAERQAQLEREEAERKAEAERQAQLEREEAERKAEAERQAELERQEAERKAEAERQAELERQEAERQAELERQEAELKAEAERQAELERQEAERKAEEELAELAKQEAEIKEDAAAEETSAGGWEDAPKEEAQSEAPADVTAATAEDETTAPDEEVSAALAEDKPVEVVPTSVEEESGPEPVVEEPLSPETVQESTKGTTIEEVPDTAIAEEPEDE